MTLTSIAPAPLPIDRARSYVAAMPPAIAGQHGHDCAFAVACILVHGFGLSDSDALSVFWEYNGRCSPPWTERELLHKLKSAAAAAHDKPRGHLLGDGVTYSPASPKPKMTKEQREQIERDRRILRLKAKARAAMDSVLNQFSGALAHYGNRSPVKLSDRDPRNDWRLLLQLFNPADILWIGKAPTDSAGDDAPQDRKAYCLTRFRPVSDWLTESEAPGLFTCPSAFKPGVTSRSNDNVVARRFLVIESDTLNKNDVCAVFRWMEQFSRIRAIVDTAGKSLHGWFDIPEPATLDDLRVILPEMGCDPALFKLAQPCRLPGAARHDKENRIQSLLYLDTKGCQ